MRSLLSEPASRIETALFFLNRLKDDFVSYEDTVCQEYHNQRELSPEKNGLYQSYMKAIEGEILRLEALVSKKSQQFDEAREKEDLAILLLQEVLSDETITPYLRTRVQTNLQGLGI
ncbi:MAG: hypothetical protein LVR00_08510 [Rhabdochlamydiaceae bacterium]|jgi:hypothetical protein